MLWVSAVDEASAVDDYIDKVHRGLTRQMWFNMLYDVCAGGDTTKSDGDDSNLIMEGVPARAVHEHHHIHQRVQQCNHNTLTPNGATHGTAEVEVTTTNPTHAMTGQVSGNWGAIIDNGSNTLSLPLSSASRRNCSADEGK